MYISLFPRARGTLGIFGWIHVWEAGTLEPLAYTSSSEFFLPYTKLSKFPNSPYFRVPVFQKLMRSLFKSTFQPKQNRFIRKSLKSVAISIYSYPQICINYICFLYVYITLVCESCEGLHWAVLSSVLFHTNSNFNEK